MTDNMDTYEILTEVLNDMSSVYHGYGLNNAAVNVPTYSLSRLNELKENFQVEQKNAEYLKKIKTLLHDNKEMINFFLTFGCTLDVVISIQEDREDKND